ncbi:MAG: cyclic nucleotide-binding domain-containing protein [Anaerolineae bacterium]
MVTSTEFWHALEQATDPTAYKPKRKARVLAARLESRDAPYYVLKEPQIRSYLRMTEPDYALWWQMDGKKTIRDLLFYNLNRYHSLPIGRLSGLVADLRNGRFLQDPPVDIYAQIEQQLAENSPASRGRRILNAFLRTEITVDGLDGFFTRLYRWARPLFYPPVQILFIIVMIAGGAAFSRLVLDQEFAHAGGGASVLTLLLANLIVLAIHELSHSLTTKHYGRELHRGGFLLYWGMPAFFVDTRDTWMAPRRARIAVSWAGPHSGLLLGGLAGLALTAVTITRPALAETRWAVFLYQMSFISYLSVFININPLLELDGYFMLMDWLDMPGLRQRALEFWQGELWQKLKASKHPRQFWNDLAWQGRVLTFYGGLTILYSLYAAAFALYYWRTRLLPLTLHLWRDYGRLGQWLLLLLTAVIVVPAGYYLLSFAWSRIMAGLEWLSRHDLLGRPDVLALLLGLPLLLGVALTFPAMASLPRADLWLTLAVWLLHIAAVASLVGVARQHRGSRFQWVIWSLAGTMTAVTGSWVGSEGFWRDWGLAAAAAAVLAAGIVAAQTVWPRQLEAADRGMIALWFLLGLGYGGMMFVIGGGASLLPLLVVGTTFAGLTLLVPMWLNFLHSRFAFPWFLLALAILSLPWLSFFPRLYIPTATLWLYAGLLYFLLGTLAQFNRQAQVPETAAIYGERERLVNGFNHFMSAMFAGYEAVFGGRRLTGIQMEIIALGPIDPKDTILQLADRCRAALLLAVDRLDDLAGSPFTRQAGEAAYDSLPWLEAETLARHVLVEIGWGSQLAQGFIQARDRRAELVRLADIFAGFDQQAVEEVVAIIETKDLPVKAMLARVGDDARRFYLIDAGRVGVFHEGAQVAVLSPGGYCGTAALLESGDYQFTYRALTPVRVLIIERERFDPLLRADTTLASQVSSGAHTRRLLKQMPLFSALSPQQLAAVDARLQRRSVSAGELIVRQGQPRSNLFIIAEGEVEVLHSTANGEEVVGQLGPGEHFGEYALFADTPYTATYRAASDTLLLTLDEATFDALVAGCEEMTHYVEQIGSSRLIVSHRRLGPSGVIA